MRRHSFVTVLAALIATACAHTVVLAQASTPAVPHRAARVAAPPETLWVGLSSSSLEVNHVGVGGRWDFDTFPLGYPDSTQGWTFMRGPSANDAGLFPLPADRPWWYYDYGNTVNGVRQGLNSRAGLIGVWHRDNMMGVSSPIDLGFSAWCGLRAPGDLTQVDPATGNPYNGDQQQGDFETGTGVRSGWPGYADQWDQLMYRDFPAGVLPLAFDMRVRLSTLVPDDPGGSAWFTPDPTNPAHLELDQPDRFRVWVGVPNSTPPFDPDRLWLSEVLDFSLPGAAAPVLLYETTGFDPPLALGPDAFTPVAGLMIPDYSAFSPTVRVVFQVKTNRTESDFRTAPGGFNSTDGAVVLDDVMVGASVSDFEAPGSITHRSSGVPPSVAWITTGRPAPGYGHAEDLAALPVTGALACGLAGHVLLQSDHDFGETPVPQSNSWAVSPTIGLSGTRAAAQGIPATLRDEVSGIVVEFDYYAGPVSAADPELLYSVGLRYKGTDHLTLLQPVEPQVPAWSTFQSPGEPTTLDGDSCRVVLHVATAGFVPWPDVDSLQVALQTWARCDIGAGCVQQYGGYFDNIRVGFVKGGGPGGGAGGIADNEFPVTFSVDGPVDPNTEGLRDPRGGVMTPQAPPQPGNTTGFGIRSGPVPPATGLQGPPPGDVFDYGALFVPADAVVFQSAPPTAGSPQGASPDGTNNQVIEPEGAGLAAGPGLGAALWTSIPPNAPVRDNIDAVSFGTDYFPPGISVGPDPHSPLPPAGPPSFLPWSARDAFAIPPYAEPVVIDDGPGIVFHFSVDPWATGIAGTGVLVESGGADAGAGLGPWTSPGRAAATIFESMHLARVGGVTVGGGTNHTLVPNPALGLAPDPAPLAPMEDDLDALESRGENVDWISGLRYWPGNVHARVTELGSDPPPVDSSWHEPRHSTPVFFSVTRNSPGVPFSAVRSQFVIDGGAAGDIFVMVKDPADPPGSGNNLLFIDEAEIGLYAVSAPAGDPDPEDYTDDLDGLILDVCPEFRAEVIDLIQYIMDNHGTGFAPWTEYGFGDAYIGAGMTISITKYLEGLIPPGCIQVGFSVTTDAIGLGHTAVDWEAGPVDPPGGASTAAGDIFYAEVTGAGFGPNYLWYDEAALGLDPGAWVNGASASLGDLPDNLDALDSDSLFVGVVGVEGQQGEREPDRIELRGSPNPFVGRMSIALVAPSAGRVRVRVLDVSGRVVARLLDAWRPAGRCVVTWDGAGVSGARVGPGIYFAVADVGGRREILKMVRLR